MVVCRAHCPWLLRGDVSYGSLSLTSTRFQPDACAVLALMACSGKNSK
jgi:hypothetical protein